MTSDQAPSEVGAGKWRNRLSKALKPLLHCSFCGKSQHEVDKLVAGPAVFICNECVAKCTAVMALPVDAPPDAQVQNLQELEALPTERLIHWLKIEAALHEETGSKLTKTVDVLRARKVSWATIGEALGVSRQAAWDRFS
jgi:hypothetical protein